MKFELPITVIYHAGCSDGFTAAWAANKAFRHYKTKVKDIVYWPAIHNTEPPEVRGREVFILDFSYSRSVTEELIKNSARFTMLDHHKTAVEHLKDLPYCVFDMNRSGAGITWDTLLPDTKRNWLVDYVEDRDLWKWELPKSEEVSAALDSYEFTFEIWDKLSRRSPKSLAEEGKIILKYRELMINTLMLKAREVEFMGYSVMTVNSPVCHSELGAKLAEGRPFAIIWRQIENKKYVYSLRSNEQGIDVAKIAEEFGSGGHFGSSSFTSNELLF